ncbi:MAG: diguanylate cyclase (GGDEF)-like protein [Alteromonadaceae bacterium]|jgi:diguanylate cyclase (GGDEF)-like protein
MSGLEFVTQQHNLSTAYITYYDNVLVVFSYLIACLAAYTAWSMASLYRIETHKYKRLIWVISGGVVMGCGIWAMHFVAMLAFRLPIVVHYDLGITLLSVVPAVLASTMAIGIIGKQHLTHCHFIYGSILFGAGIGCMHYIGMAAMVINALMVYSPLWFALSIIVVIALAYISLKLKVITEQFSSHQYYQLIKNCSILMMGTAVSGMHYVGMAAVYILPIDRIDHVTIDQGHTILSIIVIGMAVLLMLLTIAIALFERRLKFAMTNADTSRERMFEAIDHMPEGFVLFDDNDKLILYNQKFKKMYEEIGEWIKPGISYSDLVAKRAKHADKDVGEHSENYIDERLKWHNNPSNEFNETLNDGRHVFGTEQRAQSGDTVGIWTDVSELDSTKNRLVQTNKQVQMLLDASPSPILIRTIEDNEVLYFNDSAKAYFAKNHFDIHLGNKQTFVEIAHLEKLKQKVMTQSNLTNIKTQLKAADGKDYTVVISATLISYDNRPSVLFAFVDITKRQVQEQTLTNLSHCDRLCDVYDQQSLKELGTRELARFKRSKQPLSLLILAIDHFKPLHEEHGSTGTNVIMLALIKSCQYSIREVDILGRIDVDRLAILLPDTELRFAKLVSERIRIGIESTPIDIDNQTTTVTVSIGISMVYKTGPDTIEQMFERAHQKLSQAQAIGQNQVR